MVRMEFPLRGALEAGGPRLQGAYVSLQRLGMYLPVWDSKPRPPASESRPFAD